MRAATLPEIGNGDGHSERHGFLVLDASSRIVCANDEAIRILTYVHREAGRQTRSDLRDVTAEVSWAHASADDPPQAFDEKVPLRLLDSLVLASGSSSGRVSLQLKSGRRTYLCRLFTMTSTPLAGRKGAHTLFVLQRRPFSGVNRWIQPFGLTPREREVVTLLLGGLCNKEIAQQMGISVFTVKAFLRSITMKMDISGRSEIVAKVVAHALPATNDNHESVLSGLPPHKSAEEGLAWLQRSAKIGANGCLGALKLGGGVKLPKGTRLPRGGMQRERIGASSSVVQPENRSTFRR
jgi:DNA-binding CsgD family transcriptional regulator